MVINNTAIDNAIQLAVRAERNLENLRRKLESKEDETEYFRRVTGAERMLHRAILEMRNGRDNHEFQCAMTED